MIKASLIALACATMAASCASTDDAPSASLTQSSTTTRSTTTTTTPATPASPSGATTSSSTTSETTTPATPAAPSGEYTDVQLRGFIAASAAINPIMTASNGQLTPEQITQVRDALTSNGLDSETYNGIASRMRSDTAFAARVQALQPAAPAASE